MSGWSNAQRNRILSVYGSRAGTILNATGTGTQVVLSCNTASAEENEDGAEKLKSFFGDEEEQLYIAAFANGGAPIMVEKTQVMNTRRALNGKLLVNRQMPTYRMTLQVLPNSVEYYRLAMLGNYFASTKNPCYLDATIVPASSPGMNITLFRGVITTSDPGFSINGNARILDKTFTFEFESISQPQESEQKFNDDFLAGQGLSLGT